MGKKKDKEAQKTCEDHKSLGKVGAMVDQMASTNITPFPTKTENRKKKLEKKMKTIEMVFDEEDE